MTTVCSTAVCGTGGWNGPLPGDPNNSSILAATAEFGGIQLSWTLPSTNAHAVAYTNIYRSIGDDFATAIPFTAVSGTGYFDFQAAKVIRQYFYWIQHVSVNGTVLDPIGPASATAMPQIDQVITALTGRIESSALATALRERIDVITDLENGLTQIDSRVTSENSVFAQELSALRNDLTGALAYIDSQQTISINERQALVTSLNTQLAQFGDGLYAAIQDEATTRADETGDLFAQKTLKIDLAGNVAGYGLSARVDPTGEFTSDFQVRADTFSIAAPSLSSSTAPDNPYQGMVWVDTSVTPNVTKWYNNVTAAWQTTPVKGAEPFIYRTTPTTIDGYTIEPGMYVSGAVIDRLSANQIDTRGLIIRDLNGAPVIQMGTAIDWSKLGGAAPNLSGLGYSGALDATKGAPAGTYVGSTLAQDVESTAGAQAKVSAVQTVLQDYTVAEAAAAEVRAKAYADGIVTDEEARAIADATAKANAVLTTSLQKAGDAITGPVTFLTNGGILAATDADNGVFMGPNGLVGKKAGENTFAISTSGDAYFDGAYMREGSVGSAQIGEAAISSAHIGELAVDSLSIRGGAVTYTNVVSVDITGSASHILDISNAPLDGALLRIFLHRVNNSTASHGGAFIDVSVDGSTWITLDYLAKAKGLYLEDGVQGLVYQPEYGSVITPFQELSYTGTPTSVWDRWPDSGGLQSHLMNNYGVTGSGTLVFKYLIQDTGSYTLQCVADDYLVNSTMTVGSQTFPITYTWTSGALPNSVVFSANAGEVVTISLAYGNNTGDSGVGGRLLNAGGYVVWNTRRPNYSTNRYKYVRLRGNPTWSSNNINGPATTTCRIQGWFGAEIVRK